MPLPDLSIIIVSWNVCDLLKRCLETVFLYQENLNLEVIIVDNASSDQTLAMIKKYFPEVKIIANQKNLGFAKANNQGIMASTANLILLLNPDTEIFKDTLPTMVKFIQAKEKAGLAGCKHANPDLTLQPSVRRFPKPLALLLIFFKIGKILPNLPPIYYYLAQDFNYKLSQSVDQIAGSFILIKRKVLDDIGLLDENFFIWFEEVDLCKRAKAAGWEIWYYPEAEIIHHGGQSFKQKFSWEKQKLFFQSAWYYFKKHGLR